MSLILNIDTATSVANVSIAENGIVLSHLTNDRQKDHAGFLQPAIKSILLESNRSLTQLSAVSVVTGPGSYTGTRVGLASAKGLCYGLKIPLLGINTLEALAFSAIQNGGIDSKALIAPMIDARRMEVFTAVYDIGLNQILPPSCMILDNLSFNSFLIERNVVFVGDGITKWQNVCAHNNASFSSELIDINALGLLSYDKFIKNEFVDIAYSEPLYLKEFFPISKIKGG
jgi:tRNA threonylcarbamoyladenosine biosynthesis protein TsaB